MPRERFGRELLKINPLLLRNSWCFCGVGRIYANCCQGSGHPEGERASSGAAIPNRLSELGTTRFAIVEPPLSFLRFALENG